MDLEMELHSAGSSSIAAKWKKRNRKSNALCNSNDSSHHHPEVASLIQDIPLGAESTVDMSSKPGLIEAQSNSNLMCLQNRKKKKRKGKKRLSENTNVDSKHDYPRGASLMQDIPLERNSRAESIVDICSDSGFIEAQSNSNLMCLQNKKKRKRKQKKRRTDNTNVDSTHDCLDGASSLQDILQERNSCAESIVDICSNSGLIEANTNSNLMCSQNKKKRKRQDKKKHNAPNPDNTDIDLQEITTKTVVAPFRTESSVDMISKTVLESAPLGKEALGDTFSEVELAAAPIEMNASVDTSTKIDSIKQLSQSQKKRMRRKRRKESHNALEHDDKDHDLPGDNSLRKNMFPEKDSSLQLSVDICSRNELVMKQPNRDMCLFNGHNASVNNRVVNLQIANGKHLENEDVKLAPKVAELDLSTVKDDFLTSEKQSCSSKSENRILMEKHDVPSENDLVLSETKNIITYKRKKRVITYIRKNKKKHANSLVNSLDCIEEDGTRHISEHTLTKIVSVLPEGHLDQKDRDKLDEIQITVQDASHGDGVSDEILSDPKEDNIASHGACCKHPEKNTVEVEIKMAEIYPSHLGVVKADVVLDGTGKKENIPQTLQCLPERVCISRSKKKLLVLDVNGLLADIVSRTSHRKPDIMVSKKAVYKRPYCDDFLQFCFERFNVGVWSSRVKKNLDIVINFLMGDSRQNLLFCWHQSHCSKTGLKTIEDIRKPLVLKELKKLWEKVEPNLPWEKGEYGETNTLLLDDSPYKALCNPAYTAIFPYPYDNRDAKDFSLGRGGDLRVYLEGLAVAENVQEYVRQNPFGQCAITESNPSWNFYRKVFHSKPRPPRYDVNSKVIYAKSCKPCE